MANSQANAEFLNRKPDSASSTVELYMKRQSTDFEPWCHKRVYTLGYVLPTLRKFTAASVGSMSIDFVLADVG